MGIVSFIINEKKLYTEKILAEFEVPLLFICKDDSNRRFTALCVDSETGKYIVVESRISDIIDMIQNTITMQELFMNSKNGVAWVIETGDNFEEDKVYEVKIDQIPKEDLPVEGAFYEVYTSNIHDYVDLLLNRYPQKETAEIIVSFNKKFVENMELYSKMVAMAEECKEMEKLENEQGVTKVLCDSKDYI